MATVAASTQGYNTALERNQPAAAITENQKKLVTETWSLVSGDLQAAGLLLFKRIFVIAPGAQALFPKFKDVPVADLESNEDYHSHALQVTEAVDLAISSLDDLEGLFQVLQDLGAMHVKHNIQDPHFDIVGEAFIWTLEQALGSKFTSDVKEAWVSFYGMVSDQMKTGLHEAYASKED